MFAKIVNLIDDWIVQKIENITTPINCINMDGQFMEAVLNNDVEKVKYCIDKGGDIDYEWALQYAALNGDIEIVKYFVEDCDVNVNANNDEALRKSAQYYQTGVVDYLLENGANIYSLFIECDSSNVRKILRKYMEE